VEPRRIEDSCCRIGKQDLFPERLFFVGISEMAFFEGLATQHCRNHEVNKAERDPVALDNFFSIQSLRDRHGYDQSCSGIELLLETTRCRPPNRPSTAL
jgi:hypothetical protein